MRPRGSAGLLALASRRYLLAHRLQVALAVLGVALGVAVVVAIEIAVGSAETSFEQATEILEGGTTDRIVGGTGGLPEEIWGLVRRDLALRRAAPIVEIADARVDASGLRVTVLGVEPIAEAALRPRLGAATGETTADFAGFIAHSGAAVVGATLATELGIGAGDRFGISVAGRPAELEVVWVLAAGDDGQERALARTIWVDIATAQRIGGRLGRLSRIDLILPAGAAGDRVRQELRARLPPGVVLESSSRASQTAGATAAFRVNLMALSLLALVCGVFLVANSTTFSVVQRRRLFALLRCLGATRRQVALLILRESLWLGLVGSTLGIGVGILLARGLLGAVGRTVETFYLAQPGVVGLVPEPLALVKALVLGVGATMLAAAPAAHEASAARPSASLSRSAYERRSAVWRARAGWVAVGLVLLAAGLMPLPGLATSFAAIFAALLAFAAIVPSVAGWVATLLLPLRLPLVARLAVGGMFTSLSRTGMALAALAVAVSVTLGISVMIASFRTTVERWLGQVLAADLYVSAVEGSRTALDPRVAAGLGAIEGVAAVETVRFLEGRDRDGESLLLQAIGPQEGRDPNYRFIEGDPSTAWPLFRAGDAVLISESMAWRKRLGVGDRLGITTDRGLRDYDIVGVVEGYGSDRGVVTISRVTFERVFDDRLLSGAGIFLAPGADADRIRDLVAARLDPGVFRVVSQAGLRESSLEIFDRTFAVTATLRTLAGVVAFIGVLAALLALQLERTRQLGVYRALGLLPRQLRAMVMLETSLLGLLAGLLALPAGTALAAAMVFVINRRSFGWTMDFVLVPAQLAGAVALAVVAAALAGLYPAWRMAATSPAQALREE